MTTTYLQIPKPLLNWLLFCSLTIGSCKKFVEVSPPAGQITTDQLFADSATAISALTGNYMNMADDGPMNFMLTIYSGLYADELSVTTGNLDDGQLYQSAAADDNADVDLMWPDPYKYIYQANVCIENAAKSSSLSDLFKTQLTGESKFIRALCFFQLTRLFGDVPLVLTSDYRVNATMARTPQAQVMTQVVSDLQDAEGVLGSDYPGAESVRANKWAVSALLARVYLYEKKWADAEQEAAAVIGSGKYALQSDLNNVFLKDNGEAIWQLMPGDGYDMNEGGAFIPGSPGTLPNYPLTATLMNAFEPGDLRRQAWVDSTLVEGQYYYYPYKYKTTGYTPSTEYYTLLRLSEQYLIRAEAEAEQNDLVDAAADLNTIRSRAGLAPTTASDQTGLLKAIYHERQIELFAENGQRWFDLQRTGMADSVLRLLKPQTWVPTAILYPIPYNELKVNPFLTQNAGY